MSVCMSVCLSVCLSVCIFFFFVSLQSIPAFLAAGTHSHTPSLSLPSASVGDARLCAGFAIDGLSSSSSLSSAAGVTRGVRGKLSNGSAGVVGGGGGAIVAAAASEELRGAAGDKQQQQQQQQRLALRPRARIEGT